jgi:cell division protein FtsB
MAVYEGARPRSPLMPRRRLEAPLLRPQAPVMTRRAMRLSLRARRRPRVYASVLGTIVVAFLLAFFSLVQTVRVSASGFDMDQLNAEYQQLHARQQQDLSDIGRLDRESAIRREAIADGLTQLPAPVVLPAR